MGWADLDNWVEPSSRKGWVGLISTQNGRIDLSPTNLSFFLFLGWAGSKHVWPRPAWLLARLSNHVN